LTKSIGIGALFFVLFFAVAFFSSQKNLRGLFKYVFFTVLFFSLVTFLAFPALWVDPVYYLLEIFNESERVGIRKGHGQILFGEYTRDGGMLFYPLVILMKVSPFIIVGATLYLIRCFRSLRVILKNIISKYSNPYFYLLVFYAGYFFVMMYPSKKIDRYMLPLYPFFALIAVNGLASYYKSLKKTVQKRIFASLMVFFFTICYLVPLVTYYPYYFTYTSPVFGTPRMANEVVAQKPFGVGIPALKDSILEKYGDYPDLGFIDTKPMKSIYPNSKVSDIRINGSSDYDLMILGINEEIPEKVLKSEARFKKDSSLYINGLEYWRIYVKED
jgi:hypothetical protein